MPDPAYAEVIPDLTKDVMAQYHAQLKVEVLISFDKETPTHIKEQMYLAAAAAQKVADKQAITQLTFMGIGPRTHKDVTFGTTDEGTVILRDYDWTLL